MIGTARSSFDSTIFKRSRTNTAEVLPENIYEAVAIRRAEFEAKESAKREKYAEQERAKAERSARKEQSKRDKEAQAAERKRSRSTLKSEKSGNPLTSVEYNSTSALPIDEEPSQEPDHLRRGKMPPPHVRTYTNEKPRRAQPEPGSRENIPSKGLGSRISAFTFHLKTVWLKLLRALGLRNRR
jgi:hypothetical protein